MLPLLLATACTVGKRATTGAADSSRAAPAPAAARYDQHVFAGGKAPVGADQRNPDAGNPKASQEGAGLFKSMNCDGCHGLGEGWVAPSLSDGRWRYGGSDAALFQTIFYGRPKGMPAYGGLLTPALIWKLVSYIRSMPPPKALPTQSW